MTLPRSLDELHGLRAARWIRESTAGQVDRYGPAAQREQQDRALERYGLVDTGISWQVAHSGRTIGSTSAFGEMIAAAGLHFDVLLVGYVSRFARDLRTAVNARHDLHAAGAALLFCDERLLSSDEDAWEAWAREAVEAEAYSRRLARRIAEAYAAKFRTGDQGGSAGLGFRRTSAPESRLAIDTGTMPTAVTLFERYAGGSVSYRQLEAETGVAADAIRAILGNPLYNGWAVRHRRSAHQVRTAAPWRSHPPVDDELWARVQRVRSERANGGGGQARRVHLLAGRLWCTCGRRVRADSAHQANERVVRRYRHPSSCPAWSQGSHVAAVFEGPVGGQVAGLRLDAATLDRIRRLAARQATAPPSGELRRHQLQRELEGLARSFVQRRLTLEAFTAEQARLNAELDGIETAYSPPDLTTDPDLVVATLRDLRSAWRDADDAARAGLVAALFTRITVADGQIVKEELTPWARRHGLALALPEHVAVARRAGVGRAPATSYRVSIVGRSDDLAAIRRAG